jgi:hypothetical protein
MDEPNEDPRSYKFLATVDLDPCVTASVMWVRSFDHHVYLIGQHARGWAWVDDPQTFAIMAVAQASNRAVSFCARSHDPDFGDGVGLFSGIYHVALE